ncbi:hypothetical protein, partial [Micromonospora sp. KC606]|uniref:hypothetical protein n=1 Tax=Micromonospora sp. KC606 TaxID=2530379 RepID=UPI001A9D7CA8
LRGGGTGHFGGGARWHRRQAADRHVPGGPDVAAQAPDQLAEDVGQADRSGSRTRDARSRPTITLMNREVNCTRRVPGECRARGPGTSTMT